MNKKTKVNNTSFFTQRELFMFVWLKNDKKDMATMKELKGGNRKIIKHLKDKDLAEPSPLEKEIRDNPSCVREFIKKKHIDMNEWRVMCDKGYNFVAVNGVPCMKNEAYDKAIAKYEAKKAKEKARNQKKVEAQVKELQKQLLIDTKINKA